MSKQKKEYDGAGILDVYRHKDMQPLLPKSHNPHFEDHQIKLPCRIGIIGATGAKKTSWLVSFLAKATDTFAHIHVLYRESEPIYKFIAKKIGDKNISFYTKVSQLPDLKNFPDKEKQQMVVFDDFVNERNQSILEEFFLRGRKIGAGLSLFYLAQSFHAIPKFIRLQFSYLILLKIGSDNDLGLILRNYALGVDLKELKAMYKDALKGEYNFFKIDLTTQDDNKKFSRNWKDFYEVDSSDDDASEK